MYDQCENADINDKELLPAFAGAEGLINARPLTHQTADARALSRFLTNHVLSDQHGGQFALEVVV